MTAGIRFFFRTLTTAALAFSSLLAAPLVHTAETTAAAAAEPIPVDAFVRGSQFVRPRLSPDGKHLVITVRVPEGDRIVSTLRVYRLGDNGEVLAVGIDGKNQEYLFGREWAVRSTRGNVQWAVAQGLTDPARVCAYGASFGAYSAMMVAIRAPRMFKCAVGYAGVYDLALRYEEDGVKDLKRIYNQFARTMGEDPKELALNSPARLADQLAVPVLLVHGDKDEVTPLRQAEAMRAALIKAKRPPEWMLVPDEGHGFYATKNRTAFYQRLETFLARHLGP